MYILKKMRTLWGVMATALSLLAFMHIAGAELPAKLAIKSAQTGEQTPFEVEFAITPEEQATGLMHRKKLGQGKGMLFIYEHPAKRTFWMKDTLIPLDILFFNKKKQLVHIHHNARPHALTPISADENDICAVLEIAGGEAKRLNLQKNDKLMLFFQSDCLR